MISLLFFQMIVSCGSFCFIFFSFSSIHENKIYLHRTFQTGHFSFVKFSSFYLEVTSFLFVNFVTTLSFIHWLYLPSIVVLLFFRTQSFVFCFIFLFIYSPFERLKLLPRASNMCISHKFQFSYYAQHFLCSNPVLMHHSFRTVL